MTMKRKFTVVEKAGYIGETDITSFPTLREAIGWRDRHYEPDELETLHAQIACDLPDGSRTYEY
jgi:hypothetical protein